MLNPGRWQMKTNPIFYLFFGPNAFDGARDRSGSAPPGASLSELTKKRSSRSAYSGHLTRLEADIDELINPDDTKLIALKLRFSNLASKIKEINTFLSDQALTQNDIDSEIDIEIEFSKRFSLVEAKLCSIESSLSAQRHSTSKGSSDERKSSSANTCSHSGVSLPVLPLPKFGGNSFEWRSFYDQFRALVGDQDLPAVRKLNYLLSCLSGTAKDAVRGLPVLAVNYSVALDILKKRFGDPTLLIGLFAEKLVGLKPVGENDLHGFREFLDNFEGHLRDLQQLLLELGGGNNLCSSCRNNLDTPSSTSSELQPVSAVPSTSQTQPPEAASGPPERRSIPLQDLLLAPLLARKLPEPVRLDWTRKNSTPLARFNLPELISFARSELEARETIKRSKEYLAHENLKQKPNKSTVTPTRN